MATAMRRRACPGFSITETMVGLALGLIVAAAATAAWLAALAAYRSAVERVLLEERGQRALSILTALVRQAGWHPAALPAMPPAVSGADDCGQPAIGNLPACGRRGVAQSDALLVRFSGHGLRSDPSQPDHTMVDCSGFPVAAQAAGAAEPAGFVAANLVYVAAGTDGEPQLLCRYPARRNGQIDGHGWTSGALIRGVASLQLRYGVDTDGDRRPDAFLRAAQVQAMGEQAWHRVVAVQIALVLQGDQGGQSDPAAGIHAGPGQDDALTDLRAAVVDAHRATTRVFATTVRLRNAPRCEETLC